MGPDYPMNDMKAGVCLSPWPLRNWRRFKFQRLITPPADEFPWGEKEYYFHLGPLDFYFILFYGVDVSE